MVASCANNDEELLANQNDYLKLADYHEQALGSSNLDEAVSFANKELELARKLNSSSDEVKALLVLYQLYYDHGLNEESFSYASQASQIAGSIGLWRKAITRLAMCCAVSRTILSPPKISHSRF